MQHFQDGVRQGPVFLGWPHATYGAAWMLQIGILGALFERERIGLGQTILSSGHAKSGNFVVRAVDEQGRAAAEEIRVVPTIH